MGVQIAPMVRLDCALYLEVWKLFCFLSLTTDAFSLLLCLLHLQPQPMFRNPLLRSSSPRDFWGQRWNLLIHGLFKRTVYKPLLQNGFPQPVAVMSSFLVSGLFHEYVCGFISWPSAGCNLLFFLTQAPFILLQSLWEKRQRGSQHGTGTNSPQPTGPSLLMQVVCTLGTTALLVPFSPLFLEPLKASGVMEAMDGLVPQFRWVQWPVVAPCLLSEMGCQGPALASL